MTAKIRSAIVIVNLRKREADRIAEEVAEYLRSQSIEVEVFGFSGRPVAPDVSRFDLAFSLGGDGTVLYSARILAAYGIPIMAVNIGDFGFITEVSRDEWRAAFERYRDGELGISERIMLETKVVRAGVTVAEYLSLNDATISAAGISKIVRLAVALDGRDLGRYRADGVIVATPTGSTAYSAAAGGPILDPEMRALIVNPICPFTLSNRPLVLQGNEPVYVGVEPSQRASVILTCDGQEVFPLEERDTVCCRIADCRARIIRSDKRDFFEVLRSKLNWSGGPDA